MGSPVLVACVANESHRAEIESIGTQTLLRQPAQHEFYPYFFNNEPDARDWLADSQDHAHRPGAEGGRQPTVFARTFG